MSEFAPKYRQPIDVEEFERRLSAPNAQPRDAADPLAELARLVGEAQSEHAQEADMAFHAQMAALTSVAAAHGVDASHEEFEPVSEPGGAHASGPDGLPPDLQGWENQLRRMAGDPREAAGEQDGGHDHPDTAYDQSYAMSDDGVTGRPAPRDLDDVAHGSGRAAIQARAPSLEDADDEDYYATNAGEHRVREAFAQPAKSSWLSLPKIGGAALAALVVVGGASYALRGKVLSNGEAPTILAASGPAKIQPSDVEPDANADSRASVFDKGVDGKAASKVVSNEEQPVDLKAQTRPARVVGMNGENAETTQTGQAAPATQDFFPAPKKVKTVSVRPDGSIIDNPAPPAVPPQPVRQAVQPASAPTFAAPPSPATPKSTERAALAPKAPAVDRPIAESTSSTPPRALPPQAAKPAAPKPEPVAAANGGSGAFAVQFAAAGSEAEARDRIAKVQSEYGAALGGHRPGVVKGDSNGKPVFRVRAGGLSRDEAVAMCTRVKASGGNCFVAGT